MAIQKFHVRGLTREAERRLEEALVAIDGVLFATASHAEGCAEVEFEDDCVTVDEMRRVMVELGLEARIAG
jgi:hypothetical protein